MVAAFGGRFDRHIEEDEQAGVVAADDFEKGFQFAVLVRVQRGGVQILDHDHAAFRHHGKGFGGGGNFLHRAFGAVEFRVIEFRQHVRLVFLLQHFQAASA